MEYIRKHSTVEARQHVGKNTVVMSDAKGEQIAHDGDFLVGTEAHKITVVAKDEFLAEFEPLADNVPLASSQLVDQIKEADAAAEVEEGIQQVHD